MATFKKGQMVYDICDSKLYVVFSEIAKYKEFYFVIDAEGKFACKHANRIKLYTGSKKIKIPKIQNGSLVRITNPNNPFFGKKKFSVKKVEGDYVTFLTHEGEREISIACVWPVK